eukprot:COSAG01_NODE_36861_length_511_cov_30.468447_1_plen_33_part_10
MERSNAKSCPVLAISDARCEVLLPAAASHAPIT